MWHLNVEDGVNNKNMVHSWALIHLSSLLLMSNGCSNRELIVVRPTLICKCIKMGVFIDNWHAVII